MRSPHSDAAGTVQERRRTTHQRLQVRPTGVDGRSVSSRPRADDHNVLDACVPPQIRDCDLRLPRFRDEGRGSCQQLPSSSAQDARRPFAQQITVKVHVMSASRCSLDDSVDTTSGYCACFIRLFPFVCCGPTPSQQPASDWAILPRTARAIAVACRSDDDALASLPLTPAAALAQAPGRRARGAHREPLYRNLHPFFFHEAFCASFVRGSKAQGVAGGGGGKPREGELRGGEVGALGRRRWVAAPEDRLDQCGAFCARRAHTQQQRADIS